ncbi:MAG: glycosyltransferase family 4 protein [Anaerolineae bacterium]|nr:glycosyltransferase family 4 protein [Anaerolineae bacterium]
MGVRVCLCTETYYPLVGGGETQARALAEGLVALGHQVMVLTRRTDNRLAHQEMIGGVMVHRLPPVGHKHSRKWGLLLTSLPHLWRERGRYDLIFVAGFRLMGVPAVLAARLLGKRCILKADSTGEMSGDFFRAGLAQRGWRLTAWPFRLFLWGRNLLLRRADGFVAISTTLGDELVAQGIPQAAIHAIPNSVDTERFGPSVDAAAKQALRHQLGLPQTGPIIIYTGRLVSYKGLPLLLQVWRQISQERAAPHLLLVGEGGLDMHNCEADLRAYVAAQGLAARVTFTGAVQNVAPYLQAADLFVLPSEDEAFGIAALEAMACGLPVVLTAVGGLTDLIAPGTHGFLVPARAFTPLYEAIVRLLDDEVAAANMGTAGRKHVIRHYDTSAVVQKYVELFTPI